ncbi:hypothetical protein CR513_52359, partial [Mucuna pruriens]
MVEVEVHPIGSLSSNSSSNSSLGPANVSSLEGAASDGFFGRHANTNANAAELPLPIDMAQLWPYRPHLRSLWPWCLYSRMFSSMNVPNYDWLSGEVEACPSRFSTTSILAKLVKEVPLTLARYANLFSMEPCTTKERVFMRAQEGEPDYIYMYETILRELGVILPFDAFEVDVLRRLNVAPSQLHPNG